MGNVRVTAALYTGMAPPLQAIRDTVGHILQMSYQPSTEEMELQPRPLSFSKKKACGLSQPACQGQKPWWS